MDYKLFDECYFVSYCDYEDLRMYEVGSYQCPPCYSYGPVVREHYVLHFIREGKGILRLGGKEFSVRKNQAFITPPDELLYYEADEKEPWSYIWIIINGKKVPDLFYQAGISFSNPIYTPTSPCPQIADCMQSLLLNMGNEYLCIGTLYHLFHHIINTSQNRYLSESACDASLPYIRKAIQFIREKYPEPIRIQDIAQYCGLNRSYLSRIFTRATGETPQEYLIRCRINKAKKLLATTPLSIQHIANSVGYPDPFAFSKIFKKKTCLSPTEFRKLN